MSVNKYNDQTGELTTLANGSRTWIGTKAAHDAAKQAGTLPNNCLIAITDDSEDNNYSTDEKLTGKYWINGKPIYRKVFVTTSPTNAGTTTKVADLSNIDTIISIEGLLQYSTSVGAGQWEPINWTWNGDSTSSTFFYNDGIYQNVASARTNKDENIIVEYTKSTD